MPRIHPTAILSGECELADDVEIGPGCVLSGAVRLGAGVRLIGNCYLSGPVVIGEGTVVYPFACIGFPPQDVKFSPDAVTAGVEVGARCVIREHVTIHAASNDRAPTRLGDHVYMMVSTHVAHDCRIGDRATFVNGAGIAGHGEVGSDVVLGGNAVIHQHCRVGRLVIMSGDCAVSLDVPPFCMVNERNRIGGLNEIGLRRAGFAREHITALRAVFRDALRVPMPRRELLGVLEPVAAEVPPVAELRDFIASSRRGITPGFGKPPRDLVFWLRSRGGEGLDGAASRILRGEGAEG